MLKSVGLPDFLMLGNALAVVALLVKRLATPNSFQSKYCFNPERMTGSSSTIINLYIIFPQNELIVAVVLEDVGLFFYAFFVFALVYTIK